VTPRTVASVTADLIIRLLTPDLDWPQDLDLTARSFGPADAARVRANIGPIVADGRCLGAFESADRYAHLAPDGFRAYRWQRGHDEIAVDHLAAASAGTTRALWRVVASNSSVAGMVHAQLGTSDPLWWLLPEQDASIAGRRSWMLRLLDAPAAIAARLPRHRSRRTAPHHRRPAPGQRRPVAADRPRRYRLSFWIPNGPR
jgi:Acetyltransferase (GNAT) domain